MPSVPIRLLPAQVEEFDDLVDSLGLSDRSELYGQVIPLLHWYGSELARGQLVGILDIGQNLFTRINITDLWEKARITASGRSEQDSFGLPLEWRHKLSEMINNVPELASESLGDMFLLGVAFLQIAMKDIALDRQIVTANPTTAIYNTLRTPLLEKTVGQRTVIN
jgi:hypothetical protein